MKKRNIVNEEKELSPSSFRDPSGFIYYRNGILYRQINRSYIENYNLLTDSGLIKQLHKDKLLIGHREVDLKLAHDKNAYKVLQPNVVPFITYPYEWSFSMIKDSALLTLEIQKRALDHNMSLKDASAFNVQFLNGRPIFIDTLSFEKYEEGFPWVAYKQFCQHFLAPLLLMTHTDIRLNQLMKIFLDGIPLDLVSKILPKKTYLDFSVFSHIHMHAKSQSKFAGSRVNITNTRLKMSKFQMLMLIENLQSSISSLKLPKKETEWGDYYNFTNYDKKAFKSKEIILNNITKKIKPKTIWDMGANDGHFSRIAGKFGARVVSFDIDPIAVEKNYLEIKKNSETNILPNLLDLTNPTSDYGWSNDERSALVKRGPVDLIISLALVHHLTIGNNIPLVKIAKFFSKLSRHLVIEFVPKKDSQVKVLLSSRKDIFDDYNEIYFEDTFNKYFELISKSKVSNSLRIVYLFKSR